MSTCCSDLYLYVKFPLLRNSRRGKDGAKQLGITTYAVVLSVHNQHERAYAFSYRPRQRVWQKRFLRTFVRGNP